jgi:hypothetical protein
MRHDEDTDDPVTPRWWLDRGEVAQAADMMGPAQSVPTSEREHAGLAAALARRGLVALHQDGETWAWTTEQARELEAESHGGGATAQLLPATGALGGQRRDPRRRAATPAATTAAAKPPARRR